MSHNKTRDIPREEKEFLAKYRSNKFANPIASVDSVIFTIHNDVLSALTIKRDHHPYKGWWTLVGGYVDLSEDTELEDTAKRKLQEKTGVATPYLEQVTTIGNKYRDPRGWSLTTVYFALIASQEISLVPGRGASEIKWQPVENGAVSETLGFDHALLLKQCSERLRNKVLYTSLPVHLAGAEFTLHELQNIYEIILGANIEPKSFRRRMLQEDILEATGETRATGKRPAALYRKKKSKIHYFIRNLEAVSHSWA